MEYYEAASVIPAGLNFSSEKTLILTALFGAEKANQEGSNFIYSTHPYGSDKKMVFARTKLNKHFKRATLAKFNLSAGQSLRIRVNTLPVTRIKESLIPINKEKILEWFVETMLKNGFKTFQSDVVVIDYESIAIPQNMFSLNVKNFSTMVQVSDTALAEKAWIQGIGRYVEYGLGMLELQPY